MDRASSLVSSQRNEADMKLTATIPSASTNAQSVKSISHVLETPITRTGAIWRTLTELFWGYTEETGKADTKSFEGLL